jgi:hypothetical protein
MTHMNDILKARADSLFRLPASSKTYSRCIRRLETRELLGPAYGIAETVDVGP